MSDCNQCANFRPIKRKKPPLKRHDIVKERLTNRLGNYIRQTRYQLGYSIEDISKMADINHTYIERLEKGGNNITVFVAAKIASAFDMDVWELLKEAEI